MNDPDFFSSSRVGILGLGLMGGSLALALRGKCRQLYAYDPDPVTISLAGRMDAVDRLSLDLAEIIPMADVLILAAPVKGILDLIEQLPQLHPGAPVVLDIGSTKTQVCQMLAQLPERFHAVGGHPMCGLAATGLAYARSDLFRGAIFAFTPVPNTTDLARLTAEALAELIGAKSFWLDADTHDEWVAATSHIPYLLSLALTLATPVEARPLVGPGFLSSSRLAGSSTAMMADILRTNTQNICQALGRFQEQMAAIKALLEADGVDRLAQLMSEGAARRAFLAGDQMGQTP